MKFTIETIKTIRNDSTGEKYLIRRDSNTGKTIVIEYYNPEGKIEDSFIIPHEIIDALAVSLIEVRDEIQNELNK